jgi:hypothetical protein
MGIIYLIQLREFIKTGENIYKIGQSGRGGLERMKEYPKDSKICSLTHVSNEKHLEKLIILEFKKLFRIREDIGSEYFEGNCNKMVYTIHKIIQEFQTEIDDPIEPECLDNDF